MIIDNHTSPSGVDTKRQLLSVRVRETIEEQILTGALREGDQIVEYQLARQMGISQSPVREALRTLERDGVVHEIGERLQVAHARRVGAMVRAARLKMLDKVPRNAVWWRLLFL